MKRKIVFILSAAQNSHCKNRIEEFIDSGFNVEVYAFARSNQPLKEYKYKVNLLGEITNAKYSNRLSLYRKKLKDVLKNQNPKESIVYLFGLDLALAFLSITRNFDYIYEEADLTYTYIKNPILKNTLRILDKYIIRKSYRTVLTSDGFIKYHYKEDAPSNVFVIPNKLNPSVRDVNLLSKKVFDKEKLVIGFVGAPRFNAIYNFIKTYCELYPQYEFHVFGGPISDNFETLRKVPNCHLHGYFKNPVDLPEIYSKIDLVLSTYDAEFENVRYAEPNKIYEAIYFETPIIVSSNTFLAEKVTNLNIGYHLNAMSKQEIQHFIESLTKESIEEKIEHIKKIEKQDAIINNSIFINSII